MPLKCYWAGEKRIYDGSQLSSLYAYRSFRVRGDSIVAFRGPCQVDLSEMVDVEDVLDMAPIWSEEMLHFIVEHFNDDLEKTVLRQRLLIAIIAEQLLISGISGLRRIGDDLYRERKKLSVSIATATRVSTMIHTGLNLSSRNTPVPTISLPELGLTDPEDFAARVMAAYAEETAGVRLARCKVRGVD